MDSVVMPEIIPIWLSGGLSLHRLSRLGKFANAHGRLRYDNAGATRLAQTPTSLWRERIHNCGFPLDCPDTASRG